MTDRRLWLVALGIVATASARADDFEKTVRPILVDHCLSCHGEAKQKGGLRLDTKAGWQAGGDHGPAVVPGKPEQSLLVKAVGYADAELRMPPKAKLTDREVAALTKWVRDGAADPRDGPARLGGMTAAEAKAWWAFQPVRRPTVPGAGHPVDAFISAKLAARKLPPLPAADKRTLLRRATYDLTGLPPTAADVDAFLKDESPDAFAKVVDRLLASPHYGERWGRHWLDLVRYADTAGDNSDHPLPHAWRYRNWVIDAVNRDRPYDQFLKEQVAGDLLPGPTDGYAGRVVATGFLALARRFDHDSDAAMHLTREDAIDTLGQAALGLTIGCARCHDHKYDAVTARDYYALYGILASTTFAFAGCEAKQQPRDLVPLVPADEWDRAQKPHRDRLAKLDAERRAADPAKLGDAVQAKFAASRRVLSTGEIADGGDKPFAEKPLEVAVKAGEVLLLSVTPLKNYGADSTRIEWDITEAGGEKRTWSAAADLLDDLPAGNPHADRRGNAGVWWLLDARRRPTLLPDVVRDVSGKPGLHAWRNGDAPSVFVNAATEPAAVWTNLPPRSLFVHPAADGNVAVGWLSPITGTVRVTGRVADAHPGGPDGVGWVLEHFAADLRDDLLALARRAEPDRQHAELVRSAPKQEVAFAVRDGTPADARVHLRGDPEKPGDVVPRRWLEVLGGSPITGGSGRLDLANWVADAKNPLTARVLVNRVWLHHFGRGLVATPNDFGRRGAAPTHPELLDWLAAEFVAKGWSLKKLHRLILLSAAYQRAAGSRADGVQLDPNNDLYGRFDRRRLTAEELRDSLLVASGQLDREPAAAHPFPAEATWNFTQHVPFATFFETNKRSVYLVSVRNRRHPFLGLFDGADPNATTPTRSATTVPTQALFFLNDPFFHAQAAKLADRVRAKPEGQRVDELFRVTYQRPPTATERGRAADFVAKYRATADDESAAWAALTRVLLASNEFLYVE